MKKIIQLVLAIVVIVLAYLLITNIRKPIDFNAGYEIRKTKVVERLKEIRALQQAYKSVKGEYTSNFDTLENFYKTGKMQTLRSIGSLDDSATLERTKAYEKLYDEQQKQIKARRPIKGEKIVALVDMSDADIISKGLAVRKPIVDEVKSVVKVDTILLSSKVNFNIDELRYVPGVEVKGNVEKPQFEMEAKIKETISKVLVPLFEARVANEVFLKGLDKQEIINKSDEQKNRLVNNYPGLKVGDINNPNNDAGNWE
ncbi:MAG: hypothetical protein LBT27_04540 [Prevotellaceae bacterium]|jgi:hypothetical protein|nr:hypothetical protein [Prevotellaceae bacterium]